MEPLDEKGFTFIDDRGDAYWCGMRGGKPWLARRQSFPDGRWVTTREVSQQEVFEYSEQARKKPGPALPFGD